MTKSELENLIQATNNMKNHCIEKGYNSIVENIFKRDVDENEENLIKAICKLVAYHAQDFMLHYIDNLTDIEIAKELSKICNDENNINISNGKIEE